MNTKSNERQDWRRVRELLREVPVPKVFDINAYCAQVGQRRGRPIRVLTQPGTGAGDGPCGVWVATTTEDFIFVEPAVAPLHREHIVLHELGHMLCDHEPQPCQEQVLPTRLMPHLDPELVRKVLGRTSYTSPQEQEAEVFATLAGSQVVARTLTPAAHLPPAGELASALQRFSRVLGAPRT